MSFMTWSRHFETGINKVDSQHRALVDLVNKAAPFLAEAGNSGIASAGHLLDQLGHYATVHFQDEEHLMHEAGLDPAYLAHHQGTHESFGRAVATMRQQASQPEMRLPRRIAMQMRMEPGERRRLINFHPRRPDRARRNHTVRPAIGFRRYKQSVPMQG